MSALLSWTPAALGLAGLIAGFAVAAAERRRRRAIEAMTIANAFADADAQADADTALDAVNTRANQAIEDAEARAAASQAQAADLLAVADAAPSPVWRRGPDGAVLWRNAAAIAVGDVDALVPPALADRAQRLGGQHGESRTIVVGGDRRLYDVVEDVSPGGAVGWATDMTGVAEARDMLERHMAQQASILDGLSCGVEVYSPDQRLRFHNPAFAAMAALDGDWLADSPKMGEVLDAMRRARRLPETGDYPAFRRSRLALFQTVLAPQDDVIHLPDGAAWRLRVIPHADGGLVLIYEDASATLGLERDLNILLDVRRATIDQLLEGVAVFGADGRLKLYNPAFQRLWDLMPMTLAQEPHVLDVAGDAQAFFSGDADWSAFRDWMTEAVFERQPDSGSWDRIDGSRVEFVVSPLPDGNVMLAFLDVTDALNQSRALCAQAEALAQADRLRSRFEANLAREIRRPAEAILGFAEVLTDAAAGALNVQQHDYAGAIVDAGARLMDLLDEIETLAAIEAEDFVLERRPTPLVALMADACGEVRRRAERAQVRLELDCDAALEADTYLVDPGRLRQAIVNFLIDALRRTPPGGLVRLSGAVEGETLEIGIADTGYSMRPADRDPVYDAAEDAPYLAGAVTRGATGTLPLFPDLAEAGGGAPQDEPLWTELGLRLASRLIEAHAGATEMRRRSPMGGETFCRLPIAVAGAVAPPKRATAVSSLATTPLMRS